MKIPQQLQKHVLRNEKNEIWLDVKALLEKEYVPFSRSLFYDGYYSQPAFLDTRVLRYFK